MKTALLASTVDAYTFVVTIQSNLPYCTSKKVSRKVVRSANYLVMMLKMGFLVLVLEQSNFTKSIKAYDLLPYLLYQNNRSLVENSRKPFLE